MLFLLLVSFGLAGNPMPVAAQTVREQPCLSQTTPGLLFCVHRRHGAPGLYDDAFLPEAVIIMTDEAYQIRQLVEIPAYIPERDWAFVAKALQAGVDALKKAPRE